MTAVLWVAAILACYLVGSVPFGYIAGRLYGIDIRRRGSGNIGATNVARVINVPLGVAVFVLDMGKGVVSAGVVPALLAGGEVGGLPILCGAAAILGHIFPAFFGFRGGRGVATACGALACIAPLPTAVAVAVWLVAVVWTGYVSAASITAALAVPLCVIGLHADDLAGHAGELLFSGIIALLVVLRHIPNINRLIAGTEHRVKEKR